MELWQRLNIAEWNQEGFWPSGIMGATAHYSTTLPLSLRSPIDGSPLGEFSPTDPSLLASCLTCSQQAFITWRDVPAPQRGELVRRIGNLVRQHKHDLAMLITLETGKIFSEATGEVQEWIDICDFAVGLSRQLHGLTIASERPFHRLMEQWLPLGPVGVITAFNFPVAVWAWNAMLALVCGDSILWKPSEKTPLCALAAQRLLIQAILEQDAPIALCQLLLGGRALAEQMADAPQLALLSATGSVAMGKNLAPRVAARMGKALWELGGNNAAIVTPSAELPQALRAVTFAAVGTCGQRCTSLRRLLIEEHSFENVVGRLCEIFRQLPIGDPREPSTLIGPLIDAHAYSAMQESLREAEAQGGTILYGGERITEGVPSSGYYVRPALIAMPRQSTVVCRETFAPILYALRYSTLDEAIALNNNVSQGLSSAIFTQQMRDMEIFLAASGSDCGIANVNTGTSGAEIGGAFGGEKETGGGRESGSDAWKNYMRRSTNTINFSHELPLAQGIHFDIPE